MNFSFPDTEDIKVIVKLASNKENVGLFRSRARGPKVYRTFSVEDFIGFMTKTKNLNFVDLHRFVLEERKEYWIPLCGFGGGIIGEHKIRIFVPSRSLRDLLPPWLTPIKKLLPEEKVVFPHKKTYPPIEQAFSGLWFDPSRLKVLIIGQDPYHGISQANGLAFSYSGDSNFPPSLRNIFNELARETGESFTPETGDLTPWFYQGVALINTAHSVIEGQANSLAKEWYEFSQGLFDLLAKLTSSNLVILAWGVPAKKMSEKFTRAKVLTSSHPSPMSVFNKPTPFHGNNHFKLANDHLRSKGVSPINWTCLLVP